MIDDKDQLLGSRRGTISFASVLLDGCKFFADQAQKTDDLNERRFFNTACVFFAVACVEAKINEWISMEQAMDGVHFPVAFWELLANTRATLGFRDKWDLIASLYSGSPWSGDKEAFQSIDDIVSIRNELTHFKAKMLLAGEAPTRRIRHLVDVFGDNTPIDEQYEGSTWLTDLLHSAKFGEHVARPVGEWDTRFFELLLGKFNKL